MREARDVFPEVGYEERKLRVLKVLILFNDFSPSFFWLHKNIKHPLIPIFGFTNINEAFFT